MQTSDPQDAQRRQTYVRGTPLPSFQDLLCFSKSDMQDNLSRSRPVIREGQTAQPRIAADTRPAHHPRRENVDNSHASQNHLRDAGSQNGRVLGSSLHDLQSDRELVGSLHPSRRPAEHSTGTSTQVPRSQYNYGPTADHDAVRRRLHSGAEVRPGDKPSVTMTTSIASKQMLDDRPTPHPMTNNTYESRSRSEDPRLRSEPIPAPTMRMNGVTDHRHQHERPLLIQPIPSQDSHASYRQSQPAHQRHQMSIRHTAQDDSLVFVSQQSSKPSQPQSIPVARHRMHPPPSPRSYADTIERQQHRSSPPTSRSVQSTGNTAHQIARTPDASPRLSMPRSRETTFDYSCAKLPAEKSSSSPSMVMRPPPSRAMVFQSRESSTMPMNGASRDSAYKSQRLGSTSQSGNRDVQEPHEYWQLSTHIHGHIQAAIPVARRAEGQMSSSLHEREHVMMSNGQAMSRMPSSVSPRPTSSSSFQDQVRPQSETMHGQEHAVAHSDFGLRHQSRSVQPARSDSIPEGSPFGPNGARKIRSWKDVERPSDAYTKHEQEKITVSPSHHVSSMQLLNEQQSRLRERERQAEGEQNRARLRQEAAQRELHRQQRYHNDGAFLKDGRRRGHHQAVAAPSIPSQVNSQRLEPSRSSCDDRLISDRSYSGVMDSRNASRPHLPSPRSELTKSAEFEQMLHHRQRYDNGDRSLVSPSSSRQPLPQVSMKDHQGFLRHEADRVTNRYSDGHPNKPEIDRIRGTSLVEELRTSKPQTSLSYLIFDKPRETRMPQMYRDLGRPSEVVDDHYQRSRANQTQSRSPNSELEHRSQQQSSTQALPSIVSNNMGKVRPLPPVPVIASQNTVSRTPERGFADQRQQESISPLLRPLKRPRAGSDTSLILKASRFTVRAEDDFKKSSPSFGVASSPSPAVRNRELVEQQPLEHRRAPSTSKVYRDDQKPLRVSQWQPAPATGSAPITPPLSSN